MEADPDSVIAIVLSTEAEIHNCLQHTIQGDGLHPPPVRGATSSQSVVNVKAWITQITAHALGSNPVLHQHAGWRGPNSLLLERLNHSRVNKICTKFAGYTQWTANLVRANPSLSLGQIVEGLNIANNNYTLSIHTNQLQNIQVIMLYCITV